MNLNRMYKAMKKMAKLIELVIFDGGFGINLGYESDVLDTTLALSALKAAKFSNQATILPALGYLLANQNPDGGYGIAGNLSLSTTTPQAGQAITITATFKELIYKQLGLSSSRLYKLFRLCKDLMNNGYLSLTSMTFLMRCNGGIRC